MHETFGFQGALHKSTGGYKVKATKDRRREAGPRPLFLLPSTLAPAVHTFGEERAEEAGLGEKMRLESRERGREREGTHTGGQ